MKKKIQFSRKTGKPVDTLEEQLIELPLALCDHEGTPLKGQKSNTTKYLETRYKHSQPPVFLTELPWKPEAVIIEGMFIINTTPLNSHKTLADYCKFLIQRFISPQFHKGCTEVHIIFDNPGQLNHTPKYFEQRQRDTRVGLSDTHYCDELSNTTPITTDKWRINFLNCRICKRNLVKLVGNYILSNISTHLQTNQSLYVAGCFDDTISQTTWSVTANDIREPNPSYTSNAEETDTRIWLHVKQMKPTNILILSPDTDVYHIGLPLQCTTVKNIIVQINAISSKELST